jgi:hypothetical protein
MEERLRLLLAIFLCLPMYAQAELKALTAHPNQSTYYHAVRCMGLLGSIIDWTGKEKLADLHPILERKIKVFGVAGISAAMTEEQISSIENARKILLEDFKASVEMYVSRYRENYAGDGYGWQEDEIVKSDLIYCNAIADSLL